jgi:tetratricopeptide (TPR) repeat protein
MPYSTGIIIKRTAAILLISIFSILYEQQNSSGGNFIHNPDNPLFDAMFLYYKKEPEKAAKALLRLTGRPEYAGFALINHGLINEWDKNYREAEKSYKKAMKTGENLAAFYLLNMLKIKNSDGAIELLNSLRKGPDRYWADYETALVHIGRNDAPAAIKSLTDAVDNGFHSPILLKSERAFDSVRNSELFRKILSVAERNGYRKNSLLRSVEDEEIDYFQNMPYGMTKEMLRLGSLKPKETDRAIEALTSLLRTKLSFRDRSMALYLLAGYRAGKKDKKGANESIMEFFRHLETGEADKTGYKELVKSIKGNPRHVIGRIRHD